MYLIHRENAEIRKRTEAIERENAKIRKETEAIERETAERTKRIEAIDRENAGKIRRLITGYEQYIRNIESGASGKREVLLMVISEDFIPQHLKERAAALLRRTDLKIK